MTEAGLPIILASSSPRRRSILAALRVPFEARASSVHEEQKPDEPPRAYAARLAEEKACDVAASMEPGRFVLGADTVVVIDDEVLEKPEDDAHGLAMLRSLSGREHHVMTAVALVRAPAEVVGRRLVTTAVRFRKLTEDEMQRYVASGEGRDKAGGYAVQGVAAGFVPEIRGCFHNVVGLPVVETLGLLSAHGAIGPWP